MKFSDLLRFYRLLPWEKKGSWIKLLGYTVLGYALSHCPNPLILIDFFVVIGIFMYGFSVNDYFDFLLEGDSNYVGELLKTERLTRRQALLLVLLPLLLFLPSFLLPLPSLLLLLLFLLERFLNSVPPARTRNRFSSLGYLLLPLGYTLTFLQALLLSGDPSKPHLLLLPIVLVAACQDEMLGLLLRKEEVKGRERVERLSLWLSLPLFLLSLLFLPFSPFFLLTTLFSLVKGEGLRRIAKRGFRLREDPLWRRMRPLGLSLSTYHLGAYALLGAAGLF
jgi:hypothetical protein